MAAATVISGPAATPIPLWLAGHLLAPVLALAVLLAPAPGRAQAPGPSPAATPGAPVPRCGAALPLDAGQAFAGPRFLVWEDRVALFEGPEPAPAEAAGPDPDGRTPGGRTPVGRTPDGGPRWRLRSQHRLPAKPPASGLDRARVKWRDGTLWMQAGRRVYQQDPATGQWFLMADPGLDFRDFEVDLGGRVLLVATADPARRTYRALLEAMAADRRGTEVLEPYPDRDPREAFRRLPAVMAATLVTGYESVRINDYLVLYNPLARRLFVYREPDGSLREATLGLAPRTPADLAAGPGPDGRPEPPGDLCWQVLPKDRDAAWVVLPARAAAPARAPASAPTGPEDALVAVALDLAEARGADPVPLPGCRPPVFPDALGRLANLAEALGTYSAPAAGTPHPAEGGTGPGAWSNARPTSRPRR